MAPTDANAKAATKAKAKAKAKVEEPQKAKAKATAKATTTSPSLTPKAKAAGASPTKKRPAAAVDPALEEPCGAPFVACLLACVHKYLCFKSLITCFRQPVYKSCVPRWQRNCDHQKRSPSACTSTATIRSMCCVNVC